MDFGLEERETDEPDDVLVVFELVENHLEDKHEQAACGDLR